VYRELEASGRQDHKSGTGLAARTVRYVHTILKAALRDAVDQGLLATNPADKAKPPSARSAKAPDIHPWTGPQLRAFLEWAEGKTTADQGPRGRGRRPAPAPFEAYRLLAYSGMRRGELLALRWRDLDLEYSRLSIRRAVGVVKVKGEGERLVEGPTKSTRSRVIDLDPQTIDILRQWRLDRAGLSLKLVRDDALIFATIEGDYLHPERFSRTFVETQAQARKVLGADALPVIHLHDLRHTHASLLLASGEQVKVVSERLGHASVMITHEIYEHVMPGRQAEAAARFAAIIGGTA
jgi:integrase